jgi:hypothetical protein
LVTTDAELRLIAGAAIIGNGRQQSGRCIQDARGQRNVQGVLDEAEGGFRFMLQIVASKEAIHPP